MAAHASAMPAHARGFSDILLACGMLSSLVYVVANVLGALARNRCAATHRRRMIGAALA